MLILINFCQILVFYFGRLLIIRYKIPFLCLFGFIFSIIHMPLCIRTAHKYAK